MTAAAIRTALPASYVSIRLIESEAIGIVGVGEATLPHLRRFNENLGIDEAEFMAATSATFKLGIEFRDWARLGDAYLHPFGAYGVAVDDVPFHHFWRRLAHEPTTGDISDYSLPIVAARADRFRHPADNAGTVEGSFGYAYHIDATRYAPYLRAIAEGRGVERTEGRVVDVQQNETGDIAALRLEDGRVIDGDLFIDCSGFFGLLIEKTLQTGYDDWRRWLPCDRAVALPSSRTKESLPPYTKATAHDAGWRWQIPLRHRVGNGYVHCSEFIDEESATATLLANLEGDPLAEPRTLRFTPGVRREQWRRNCIAIGLSGGFLEPLESTSIYLIQAAIEQLIDHFPLSANSSADYSAERSDFNRYMQQEFERVRDFLILHYVATERRDSPFWQHISRVEIPDSLAARMELFRQFGRFDDYQRGLFLTPSWLAVFLGQRIQPERFDSRAAAVDSHRLRDRLSSLRQKIATAANSMPRHGDYLERYSPGVGE